MSRVDLEIEKKLVYLGFELKEAKIYLALLELGRGRVSEITRRANIHRTS